MGSSTVLPLSPASLRTHTHSHSTPRGRSAHVCFDFAPRFGAGGLEGDGVVVLEDLKDAWQWIRQIRAKTVRLNERESCYSVTAGHSVFLSPRFSSFMTQQTVW